MRTTDIAKPSVVLIPGMWSTGETLSELRRAFEAQGYEVDSLCLPEHKKKAEYSKADKARLAQTSLQQYADFIVAKVRTYKVPPILVGHSMGGLLAQLVAARVPVNKLVLLSSAAPGGINGWSWSVIRTLGRNLLLFPLWRKVTEMGESNVRYGIANSQSASVQKQVLDNMTFESGMATFQIGVGGFSKSGFSRVDAKQVTCPILVIGGSADRITPIKIQRAIAKKYGQQAKLAELPDVCHWTIGGSNLPRVTSVIFDWLDEQLEIAA
ncbi:Alpha/beta hydrolase family [Vibrio sp. B1FLJ16]|uniref:alpha/beta hydrolase n=1 Tax=Vibrio sp. B1FLJ16 TaxID=2751178 RepID=UPI0015F43909|nr:alpha/beta hydrolase [Vibrio sp. B1FLJ16]CAD7822764.1 Alpha/beta hydrolase family [Vibrio sp. B1FLJ16]CAE6949994.1 Alpha/beta hydrolase family [Vibrio sp. B1FLJ16]